MTTPSDLIANAPAIQARTPADAPDRAQQLAARASRLRWALFDVDGILTDGALYYGPDGEQLKRFNSLDGHGLKMLQQAGIRIGLLSGRDSAALRLRARELGFDAVMLGIGTKLPAWVQFLNEQQISAEQCAYMGDDVLDLQVLRRAGFASTVFEAPASVRKHVDWVATRPAGHGAVRELCDDLIEARGQTDALLAEYLL